MIRNYLNYAFVLLVLAAPLRAEETEPKSYEVKSGPFRVEVTLDGVFEAETMTEIAIYPKEWSEFTVVEAAEHGQVVRKGEAIIRFDDSKLSDAIADMEAEQRLAELAIIQAERNLPALETSLELARESAARAAQIAETDLTRYTEIDRPLAERSAAFRLKSMVNFLEYTTEELEQLEKMYTADELTEESEEIVLKRQRDSVESAQFSVDREKINLEETLNVELPRQEKELKHKLEQARLAHDQAKIDLDLKASQKRFELEKSKHERSRSLEKHAKLLADRELMVISAPADGVVYYGQCVDGKWPEVASQTKALRPNGSVTPESVFMTIVNPRPVNVVAKIDEKEMAGFVDGLEVRIEPTANPNSHLKGKLVETSSVPVAEGKFGAEFSVIGDTPAWIVPGMTCKVVGTTYEKEAAVTIPAKAIHSDDADSTSKYVYILGADGAEPIRQPVQVGKQSGDTIEIISGLKEGDRVSLEEASAS